MSFITAVTLSFLKESEQALLADCTKKRNVSVDMKKAESFRNFSGKGRMDKGSVYRLLTGGMIYKPDRMPTVKVNKAVYAKYFKPNQSAKEVQTIVEKAPEMYFGKQ